MGLVDGSEQMLLLHIILHQMYCAIGRSLGNMIDLVEDGGLCFRLDFAVDARAACDAISAVDACEFRGCRFKVHFISVRDGLVQGIIGRIHWADARAMLADGLAKGGVDMTLLAQRERRLHIQVGTRGAPP